MGLSILWAYIGVLSLWLLFLTALRWQWMERFLSGFAHVSVWHHRLAYVFSFSILLHLTIELSPYHDSFLHDLLYDRVLQSGLATTVVLLLPMLTAWNRSWRRGIWLNIHRFTIFALPLIVWHVITVRTPDSAPFPELSDGVGLGIALVTLIVAGVTLLAWYRPTWIYSSKNFTVAAIRVVDPGLSEITLQWKNNTPQQWEGGKFGFFQFLAKGPNEVSREFHAFSLADSGPNECKLLIHAVGHDTERLQTVKVGTIGRAYGPYGKISRGKSRDHELWIAGGMGLAPFLGALRDPTLVIPHVTLLVLYREGTYEGLRRELRAAAARHQHVQYIERVDDGKQGSVRELLPDSLKAPQRFSVVKLSGPRPMIQMWKSGLKSLGQRSIYTEDFMR